MMSLPLDVPARDKLRHAVSISEKQLRALHVSLFNRKATRKTKI